MKYIWVGCDSETNEKHGKDCNQEWFQLVTAKLDRNWWGGDQGRYEKVWDRTKLELGWNRPRQYPSGVSEDLGGVK